jgi:hypothetical protein
LYEQKSVLQQRIRGASTQVAKINSIVVRGLHTFLYFSDDL